MDYGYYLSLWHLNQEDYYGLEKSYNLVMECKEGISFLLNQQFSRLCEQCIETFGDTLIDNALQLEHYDMGARCEEIKENISVGLTYLNLLSQQIATQMIRD